MRVALSPVCFRTLLLLGSCKHSASILQELCTHYPSLYQDSSNSYEKINFMRLGRQYNMAFKFYCNRTANRLHVSHLFIIPSANNSQNRSFCLRRLFQDPWLLGRCSVSVRSIAPTHLKEHHGFCLNNKHATSISIKYLGHLHTPLFESLINYLTSVDPRNVVGTIFRTPNSITS